VGQWENWAGGVLSNPSHCIKLATKNNNKNEKEIIESREEAKCLQCQNTINDNYYYVILTM